MTIKDLEVLYDYCYWANKKLFDAIARLTPEQFTQPVAGGHGSIRNALVHVLSAEAGWLDRCGGAKRGPRLHPADFPTVESVVQAWNKVEANVRELLGTLTDEDLVRNAEYSTDRTEKIAMPLGELMQHAANHGIHHRGQVALMLRMLGQEPGYFDMLIYYAGKRGVPAW